MHGNAEKSRTHRQEKCKYSRKNIPPPGLRRVLERPIIQPDAQEGMKVMKKIVVFLMVIAMCVGMLAGEKKLCLDCYESYDRFDV